MPRHLLPSRHLDFTNTVFLTLLYIRLTVGLDKALFLQVGVVQGNLRPKVPVSAGDDAQYPLRRR